MDAHLRPTKFDVQKTDKPWGYELLWAHNTHYAAKILHIMANHALSLQVHREKHETMCVLNGMVELEIHVDGHETRTVLNPGESFHIPAGVTHRLSALITSDVLEASTPQLDDVVRLADDYGRAAVRGVVPGRAAEAAVETVRIATR